LSDGSKINFGHQAHENQKLLVSVVIVTWNKAEFTLATLRALLNAKGTNLEVILVDNGSTDETHKLFKQLDSAKIITNSTNLGFVNAVNQGAAKATGDFILLLNNDACPKPDAINKRARSSGMTAHARVTCAMNHPK
jgi:GT2 family glycosyltransferase